MRESEVGPRRGRAPARARPPTPPLPARARVAPESLQRVVAAAEQHGLLRLRGRAAASMTGSTVLRDRPEEEAAGAGVEACPELGSAGVFAASEAMRFTACVAAGAPNRAAMLRLSRACSTQVRGGGGLDGRELRGRAVRAVGACVVRVEIPPPPALRGRWAGPAGHGSVGEGVRGGRRRAAHHRAGLVRGEKKAVRAGEKRSESPLTPRRCRGPPEPALGPRRARISLRNFPPQAAARARVGPRGGRFRGDRRVVRRAVYPVHRPGSTAAGGRVRKYGG